LFGDTDDRVLRSHVLVDERASEKRQSQTTPI
jgi:hypothetical protein